MALLSVHRSKPKASSSTWVRTIFWPDHATLNWRAAVWHGLLVVFIVVLWQIKDPPFYIEFNKLWSKPDLTRLPPFMKTTLCDGEDYAERGVWEWFDCVRAKRESQRWVESTRCDAPSTMPSTADDYDPFYPSVEEGFGRLKVSWLLLCFEVITAAVHYWMWVLDRYKQGLYTRRLGQQLQPWRWLEYSVTASIMLWAALSLSRVQDQFLLFSLFINSFFLNFVGGGLFEICGWAARQKHTDLEMAKVFRTLQWICFGSGWFAYGINLWTSWDALGAVIQPYLDLPNGVLWGELFDVVVWVNLGITITYAVFPIIHLYVFDPFGLLDQYHRAQHGGRERDAVEVYKRGEKLYIYGSFVAKTTLVATIGVAAWMRRD